MSVENKSGKRSDRLITATTETQAQLEEALDQLQTYANALDDLISSMRKRPEHD